MARELDRTMRCLCCDVTVLVSSEDLAKTEVPAALCKSCARTLPPAVIKTFYVMRSQIVTQTNELELVKKDIQRLYRAQQDMEEALLGTTATP